MNDASFSGETRAFAYWMSGSLHFAEELAEEELGYAAGRCREVLEGRPPRGLPAMLPCREDSGSGFFLGPFPDTLFPGLPEPEAGRAAVRRYEARESVSFAFLAALQAVPAQARAALVLHDLLGRDAVEAGEVLAVSVSSLANLLECARDIVDGAYDAASGRREPPPEERAATLFMRYIFSWEAAYLEGFPEMLAEDVLLQLLPSGECRRGREAVTDHLVSGPLAGGAENARGRWRLLPTRANGQLAFGVYERDRERHMFKSHSLQVIFFEEEAVTEIVSFADPELFHSFEFLSEVHAQG